MSHYVVRPWEREAFKRCRRAWDLSATERQNYEPRARGRFDVAQALRDALAVYYFPGMWDWNRAIVSPLVLEAYDRAAARQEGTAEDPAALGGRAALERYIGWAPPIDRFSPVQVAVESDAQLPDREAEDRHLCVSDGRDVRFRARADVVVVDPSDAHWLVEHRVVEGAWDDVETVLVDDTVLAKAWAWEQCYLGTLQGTIVNELRLVAGEPPRSSAGSMGRPIVQHGNEWFRRTQIRRTRPEIEGMGARLAGEVIDMTAPWLRPYPTPAPANCGPCQFRAPCLALTGGDSAADVLASSYRQRRLDEFEPGRLGAVWGFHPGPR